MSKAKTCGECPKYVRDVRVCVHFARPARGFDPACEYADKFISDTPAPVPEKPVKKRKSK